MNRLPVVARLSSEEVGRRYRNCPDPKEKTHWRLIWLLLRPGEPLRCERAAPPVGLSYVHARAVLRRWNAQGPEGLADRRRHNKSPGKLAAARLAQLYEALQQEPPDDGLWSGPKVAAHVRDRRGVEACPQTGLRWLKKLGWRLPGRATPRPPRPNNSGGGFDGLESFLTERRRQDAMRPVELGCADEARLGLKPVNHRVWALKGCRPQSCGRQRFQSL